MTLVELTRDFDLHPTQIEQWRDHILEGETGAFGEVLKGDAEHKIYVKTLEN